MTLIKSLGEYLNWINQLRSRRPNDRLLFRGHSNKQYDARPSIFRNAQLEANESFLLKELLAKHPVEFENDNTTLERLARAQHYGLSTRLLDVTRNPLVALFFACKLQKSQAQKRESTGEVIVFTPKRDRQKYFDSDTISCLANLSQISYSQLDSIKKSVLTSKEIASEKHQDNEPEFHSAWIKAFNENDDVKRLVQLVSIERPGFEPRIDPISVSNIFAVIPKIQSKRISAQDGEFLIFGLFPSQQDALFIDEIEFEEVYISGANKPKILSELSLLSIAEETLFPEIDKTAAKLVRDIKVPE